MPVLKDDSLVIDGIPYTADEVKLAAQLYPFTWMVQNAIKNESGITLTFERRPWVKDIINDLSPKQAWLKPPQIGATVSTNLKAFWVANQLGKDIIYTLPTQTDVEDIVGGSVNRIIAQNEILKGWVHDHDTVAQKSVGANLIRYRGTFSPKQATMVPSSLNIHDEVDNSDLATLTLYETRLEAQEGEENKWRWYFSHPSIEGHGVAVYWAMSDMKEWYIVCQNCQKEQSLTWPDSINIEQECYQCKSCKVPLTEEARTLKGRWINRDGVPWDSDVGIVGDYEFSGWHVSQLMLYNKSARDIIKAFNDPLKDKQYFYNYVLGLPYVSSEDRIEPAVVLRNCVDSINPQEGRVVIGVDTGLGLHMTLMNKDGVFYYEHDNEITPTRTPYDRLKELMRRFPKSVVFLDQGGELMLTRVLQQEFPGRVFLVYYNKDRKSIEIVDWGEDEEYWKVKVDRNRMMTLMVEQLRDTGRVLLNGTRDEWSEFASHFGYLYREKLVTKEAKGKDDRTLYGSEYVWKRNGPDHFAHSLLYAMVGMQRYGGEAAKIVGASDGIPGGWSTPSGHREGVYGKEAAAVAGIPSSAFNSDNRVI